MICTKTKQWGNSVGIIIPKDVVRDMKIKPNEEICIDISKKKTNVLREMFGTSKFSKPTSQPLKEIRNGESKYL